MGKLNTYPVLENLPANFQFLGIVPGTGSAFATNLLPKSLLPSGGGGGGGRSTNWHGYYGMLSVMSPQGGMPIPLAVASTVNDPDSWDNGAGKIIVPAGVEIISVSLGTQLMTAGGTRPSATWEVTGKTITAFGTAASSDASSLVQLDLGIFAVTAGEELEFILSSGENAQMAAGLVAINVLQGSILGT
jgi:hypothetical protein